MTKGQLKSPEVVHTLENALSLNEEPIELRKRVKEQEKEICRLKEENEVLEEASAFFAVSHRKSAENGVQSAQEALKRINKKGFFSKYHK